MTIIQPNRSSSFRLNWLIAGLVLLLVASSVWLVSLYNRIVNLEHGTAAMRREMHEIRSANADMKEEIFGLMDSGRFEELAASRGLVKDRDPRYLQIDPQWSLATHY
jgi:cell division protein FtsB